MVIEADVKTLSLKTVSVYKIRKQEWIQYFRPYFGRYSINMNTFLYRVRSYGDLRLVSKNPFDYPLIDPKFLCNPYDFEDI